MVRQELLLKGMSANQDNMDQEEGDEYLKTNRAIYKKFVSESQCSEELWRLVHNRIESSFEEQEINGDKL